MPNLAIVKPHKITQTKMDTIVVTREMVKEWKAPPFQRRLKVNDKVKATAERIKQEGVIPGVIVLGVLRGVTYLCDGQHRAESFMLSGEKEVLADVRTHYFDTMADMSAEFLELNSQLVPMKPDDKLRSLEPSNKALQLIRERCPFVGYDYIRRGNTSPIVSMSIVIRAWFAAMSDCPQASGESALERARKFEMDEAEHCCDYLQIALEAWGRDVEYRRLWAACNLTLCAWLYRRMVITPTTGKTYKANRETFRGLLTALSADRTYMDWLYGRLLNDRDRSPGYNRIKSIFARKLHQDTGKKPMLPSPEWAHGGGRS